MIIMASLDSLRPELSSKLFHCVIVFPRPQNHPGIAILHHQIAPFHKDVRRIEKKHKKEEVGKYNFTSISKMKESSI